MKTALYYIMGFALMAFNPSSAHAFLVSHEETTAIASVNLDATRDGASCQITAGDRVSVLGSPASPGTSEAGMLSVRAVSGDCAGADATTEETNLSNFTYTPRE